MALILLVHPKISLIKVMYLNSNTMLNMCMLGFYLKFQLTVHSQKFNLRSGIKASTSKLFDQSYLSKIQIRDTCLKLKHNLWTLGYASSKYMLSNLKRGDSYQWSLFHCGSVQFSIALFYHIMDLHLLGYGPMVWLPSIDAVN